MDDRKTVVVETSASVDVVDRLLVRDDVMASSCVGLVDCATCVVVVFSVKYKKYFRL